MGMKQVPAPEHGVMEGMCTQSKATGPHMPQDNLATSAKEAVAELPGLVSCEKGAEPPEQK